MKREINGLFFFFSGRRDYCEDVASQFHILGKMGDLSEVAAAGVFLCSRDAQFITGKTPQPAKIDLNKKSLAKQKTIQNFTIDAQGFRKTKNENPPT